MHYCCVKYCQNKSINARLVRFLKGNCRFTAELKNNSRKQRIAWFRAIKFKNTYVSIDSIDDCRICESHFKLGKWLNAALIFYKALRFIIRESLVLLFVNASSLSFRTLDCVLNSQASFSRHWISWKVISVWVLASANCGSWVVLAKISTIGLSVSSCLQILCL